MIHCVKIILVQTIQYVQSISILLKGMDVSIMIFITFGIPYKRKNIREKWQHFYQIKFYPNYNFPNLFFPNKVYNQLCISLRGINQIFT